MRIEIKSTITQRVLHVVDAPTLRDAVETLTEKGANLGGANLGGAYLEGAYLEGAKLEGAKHYSESHAFFKEVVRRQKHSAFTSKEWECIAQICIYEICWKTIRNRFSAAAMRVFKKLADRGYDEFLVRFNESEG